MTIVTGWRTRRIASFPSPTLLCAHCQTPGTTQFDVDQEYFHLLWMPCFPVSKQVSSQCSRCGTQFGAGHFPESYNAEIAQARRATKTPAWMFVGLPVIVVALLLALQDGYRYVSHRYLQDGATRLAQCLAHLAPGQRYEVNVGANAINPGIEFKKLYLVAKVDAASVEYSPSGLSALLSQSLLDGTTPPDFSTQTQTVSRADFSKMRLLDCRED